MQEKLKELQNGEKREGSGMESKVRQEKLGKVKREGQGVGKGYEGKTEERERTEGEGKVKEHQEAPRKLREGLK